MSSRSPVALVKSMDHTKQTLGERLEGCALPSFNATARSSGASPSEDIYQIRMGARSAAKIWSEAELGELVDHVAHNPELGDVIQGTGGVRNLRWGKVGSGKRGGARVIYFYYHPGCPIYLPLAYARAQATDLTPDEKKAVAGFAAIIKTAAGIAEGNV